MGSHRNGEVNAEIPYLQKDEDGLDSDGIGDVTLGTKFNFWGRDLPGAQAKTAVLLNLKLPTGDEDVVPRLGTGSVDVTAGLAAGYEGRRWYGFVSGRYRLNTKGAEGREKGDRVFVDLVGGFRPILSEYREPDTVLMLELNWEYAERDELGGISAADSGGSELFISPVIWWTFRQVAIRGGVQIPIAESLNGTQPASDYRGLVELVYHY